MAALLRRLLAALRGAAGCVVAQSCLHSMPLCSMHGCMHDARLAASGCLCTTVRCDQLYAIHTPTSTSAALMPACSLHTQESLLPSNPHTHHGCLPVLALHASIMHGKQQRHTSSLAILPCAW
jgi:hypothetical protein